MKSDDENNKNNHPFNQNCWLFLAFPEFSEIVFWIKTHHWGSNEETTDKISQSITLHHSILPQRPTKTKHNTFVEFVWICVVAGPWTIDVTRAAD